MILTIDIGNTNQTYFLTHLDEEILHGNLEHLNADLEKNRIQLDLVKTYISSVKDSKLSKVELPNILVRKNLVNSHFLGMPVHYTKTIGDDRLVAAFYFFQTSKKKQLIIDSGSFTTIDLVDGNGFHGGFILPGWNKIRDNYSQGENLKTPELHSLNKNSLHKIPKNTEEAINKGALLSFLAPIKQIIELQSPEVVFIYGGNQKIISEYLTLDGINIPIKCMNNVVHLGLQLLAKERLI